MKQKIHYTRPSITTLEVDYAADAAANGWGEKCYAYIEKFEHLFASHLGVKHAIATSSCTGAIHMGLAALDIGPGDEVILADTNWIASVAPVTYLGATPVFVDIKADTWCLDPEKVRQAITPNTKAIIAVHLYGNLCDMTALLDIGEEYGLAVIEDAAEAIGSLYNNKRAGSLGTFGTFSFHGTKTVTTGEGGMFVTNDSDLYERVLTLSNHGRSKEQVKQFWPDEIGFKYKMSNIQAAIGCGQMERIEELIAGKRKVFEYYQDKLKGCPASMNPATAGTSNGYWMPNIVIDAAVNKKSGMLIENFKRNNIDARVFFWPLSSLDMFESCENPVSYSLPERAVNLPSYHDLSPDDMDRVISIIQEYLKD